MMTMTTKRESSVEGAMSPYPREGKERVEVEWKYKKGRGK